MSGHGRVGTVLRRLQLVGQTVPVAVDGKGFGFGQHIVVIGEDVLDFVLGVEPQVGNGEKIDIRGLHDLHVGTVAHAGHVHQCAFGRGKWNRQRRIGLDVAVLIEISEKRRKKQGVEVELSPPRARRPCRANPGRRSGFSMGVLVDAPRLGHAVAEEEDHVLGPRDRELAVLLIGHTDDVVVDRGPDPFDGPEVIGLPVRVGVQQHIAQLFPGTCVARYVVAVDRLVDNTVIPEENRKGRTLGVLFGIVCIQIGLHGGDAPAVGRLDGYLGIGHLHAQRAVDGEEHLDRRLDLFRTLGIKLPGNGGHLPLGRRLQRRRVVAGRHDESDEQQSD